MVYCCPAASPVKSRLLYSASVRGVAAGLRELGLPAGARVMIRMGNDADYVITYFAALAAGLVAQPSSPQLTAGEAAFLMQDSGAAVIAAADDCPLDPEACRGRIVLRRDDIARLREGAPLADYADTAADDPATLVYTGRKGCCTPTAPSGAGGRCTISGSACARTTWCCMPAP